MAAPYFIGRPNSFMIFKVLFSFLYHSDSMLLCCDGSTIWNG